MQVTQVVLGKQSLKSSLVAALKSCEQKGKIRKEFIDPSAINFSPDSISKMADRPRNIHQEAWQIKCKLQEAEKIVFVDAQAFENALALVNENKKAWNIADDVVEKLFLVVYDPEKPERAEVVQDIKEAFDLIGRFDRENKTVFITEAGHAFDFVMDLEKYERELRKQNVDLPDFEKIVETNPEVAWSLIRSKILAGKKVFVHETLLLRNPTIALMQSSLEKNQRKKLNFVK